MRRSLQANQVMDNASSADQTPTGVLLIAELLNRLVRPLLATMFGGAIVYMAIVGLITAGEFMGIAAVVVGFFFQSRQIEKSEARLQAQTKELVELAKAVPPEASPPTR